MAQTERSEIRVFLSSTFKDMDAERSHLVKEVFPRVRAACLARQVGFTEIDLRWGVSEEASQNGATVEICLKEIDRCRNFPPFFIGFLGERYGWIPKEKELADYWSQHTDSPYAQTIRHAIERDISVTELEMELAVLSGGAADKLHDRVLFLLRDPSLTDQLYTQQTGQAPNRADTTYYDPAAGRLDSLKTRLRQSCYLHSFDRRDTYTSIDAFGHAIETYLLAELDRHFPADAIPSPFEAQRRAHAAFRFHRLQNFLPRPDVRQSLIDTIAKRIDHPVRGPILLHGPSGQGKSALIADLARHLENHPVGDTHCLVIDHYFGADAASSSLDAWIIRVLQTLLPIIDDTHLTLPEATKDRREALSTWTALAARKIERDRHAQGHTGNTRIVFLLDAIDQRIAEGESGVDLEFLQAATLGPDCLVVLSAADGTAAYTDAKDAHAFEAIAVSPLTQALKREIIAQTLSMRYQKTLSEDQITLLVEEPKTGTPLFLMLALEELRVDARFETLTDRVETILSATDAADLFLNAFLLDPDYSRPEQLDLAAKFMALMSASYAGLTEHELADLLALNTDPVAEDTGKPRLPQVILSKLMAVFQPFLLDKAGRRAPMHRVLGEVAVAHCGEEALRRRLYDFFASCYGDQCGERFEARGAAETLFQITRLAKGFPEYRAKLQADLGHLPTPVGLHQLAEPIVFEALSLFDHEQKTTMGTTWGEMVTRLAEQDIYGWGEKTSDFISWIHSRIGHYQGARVMQEPMLKLHRRILGPDHPETLTSMSNLAMTLKAQGDVLGARDLNEKTLKACRQVLGDQHPLTLISMSNIAIMLNDHGDRTGASGLNERILETRRWTLGEDHPDTLTSMNNLAISLRDQGDLSGAQALGTNVLKAFRRTLGDEHQNTLVCMDNLAKTLRIQGDLMGAQVLGEKALRGLTRVLGATHPETLTCMNCLGGTYFALGNLTRAREFFELAMQTRIRIFGENHPATLVSIGDLGGVFFALGDLNGARALFEQTLEAQRLALGERHSHTLVTMGNLAQTLEAMGDFDRMLEIRFSQVNGLEFSEGPAHEETLRAMQRLAVLLRNAGRLAEAEPLQRDTLSRLVSVHGHNSINITPALSGLGALLLARGDLTEAEEVLRRALEIRERELGHDADETKLVRSRLQEVVSKLLGQFE